MRYGLALGALVGGTLVVHAAHAGSFPVTSTNDSGAGTLRDAITRANASPGPHTIPIAVTGTISLASELPNIAQAMTITGPGAAKLTVQRGSGTRYALLTIANAAVEIQGLTIARGEGGTIGGVGGIDVRGGSLSLSDCVLLENSGDTASAIYASGELSITRSVIRNNAGRYSAVYATGTTTITDTTIADNTVTAIVFPPDGRVLTIERSTISGNRSDRGVGGLQLQGGTAVIRNSTFSGNTGRQAGDFWTYSDGVTFRLLNVTAIGSSSPSIWTSNAGTVYLRNTLLGGTGARCSLGRGGIVTEGNNLSSDATCALNAPSDKPNTAPQAAPLADNGGFTKTHALLAGSPAINSGNNTALLTTDQRGKPRIAAGTIDIGAYEVEDEIDAGADGGDAGTDADAGDASPPDSGLPRDAGSRPRDAGTNAGGDAGDDPHPASPSSDGCDCVAAGTSYGTGPATAASSLAFALLFARRRRRS
ncbi:choice-of-anchor Q domain-containing protein [Pendulispora albinea]|uniref:Right-handed parallel beta-helix repeat-containing protein n=1 Tax=Pendulispora albinea TaxID=2741071 RepID=A0ABZ2LL51_9BACT